MTPHAKFHVNLLKRGFRQIGQIYAKIFIVMYLFFFHAPTGQTPQQIFARNGSNDAVSGKGVPFLGLEN